MWRIANQQARSEKKKKIAYCVIRAVMIVARQRAKQRNSSNSILASISETAAGRNGENGGSNGNVTIDLIVTMFPAASRVARLPYAKTSVIISSGKLRRYRAYGVATAAQIAVFVHCIL